MKNDWTWRICFSLLVLLAGLPASAHAMLDASQPAAGAELAQAPRTVILQFDSALELSFCRILLKHEGGDTVPTGKPELQGKHDKGLRLALPALPAGTYRVIWSVVGRDGHRTSGNYSFSIQ